MKSRLSIQIVFVWLFMLCIVLWASFAAYTFAMAGNGNLPQAAEHTIYLPYLMRQISLPGKIVYMSNYENFHGIYTMNPIGGKVNRLSSVPDQDASPQWSPDGSKIAFDSMRNGGNHQVYIMDSDGLNVRHITNGIDHAWGPRWSPDGAKIVFQSYNSALSRTAVCVVNVDGSGYTQLTDYAIGARISVWSPDGSKIAYYSYYANPSGVYTINPDGSTPELLFEIQAIFEIDWSPDGRFLAIPYSNKQIMLYDLESKTHFFIDLPVWINEISMNPLTWSPDGSRILFAAKDSQYGPDTLFELYTINRDGSDLLRITDNSDIDTMPDWAK